MYEYRVVGVHNDGYETVDIVVSASRVQSALEAHAVDGWRLVAAYSQRVGSVCLVLERSRAER